MCWFFSLSVNCSIILQKPALVFRVLQIEGSSHFLWPPPQGALISQDREVPVGASRTLFRIAGALNANKAWKRSQAIFDKFSNCFLAVYKSIVYKNQSTQTNSWNELSSRRRLLISTAEHSSWVSHSCEHVILNICRLDGPTLYMCIFLNMELISWRPAWHPGLCICHHGLFQSLLVLKFFFFLL